MIQYILSIQQTFLIVYVSIFFRTSFKMGAYFCPHCGNKTMIKVLAQTAGDGTVQYRPLSKKQFSHRGLRVRILLVIMH